MPKDDGNGKKSRNKKDLKDKEEGKSTTIAPGPKEDPEESEDD